MDTQCVCKNAGEWRIVMSENLSASSKPLVSICIPTFERPKVLLKAIESCFYQTYRNFEIVITDNSESNETQKLVERLGRKNIRYIKNIKNIGPIHNLKLAIDSATGKYVKVLMDDDILLPSIIEEMVEKFEEMDRVGVVMAPMFIINDSDERINYRAYLIKKFSLIYEYQSKSGLIPGKHILKDFLTKSYPGCEPSGIMYRKSCFDELGSIDVNMKFAVDVEICARFATAYDFYYINKPLSEWRYSNLSHTVVNLHQKGQDTEIYYKLTKKLINDPNVLNALQGEVYEEIRKDAYFFSSKRAVLSIIAGMRSKNLALITQTIEIMRKNDPYPSNFLKLPFNLLAEVFKAGLSWLR